MQNASFPSRPRLREDLSFMPGPASLGGVRTWTLHDPVCHRFFRIGPKEFEILSHWEKPDDEILKIMDRQSPFSAAQKDIDALCRFLAANHLLRPDHPTVSEALKQKARRSRHAPMANLVARSFFFRIPLLRPDRFLDRTLAPARVLWSVARIMALPALALALYILLRQWSAFTHTLFYFFTPKGIFLYGLAILAAKLAHEMGHAYAAKHFGLHVPTMGLAFMFLWPILYTDTTEAWRIRERRPRMIVTAAGMGVELGIAVLATLFWAWLPDGPWRSACFILSTTTWIKSLAINTVPFLRFDGYYFLSDWLDIPNLHQRAFAFGRWYLRQGLLGVSVPPPESMPRSRQRLLIIFAFATWIYRIALFTGIALMVYHFCFKLLGLALFSIELIWFLGRPVWQEIKAWPRMIGQAGVTRQTLVFGCFLVSLCLFVLVPQKRIVHLPALVKPGVSHQIYPPDDARILAVHVRPGQPVEKGSLLFELESPDLLQKIRLTRTRLQVLEAQIRRQNANSRLREQGRIYDRQLAEAQTALAGYKDRKERLGIRAPAPGIIRDMPDGLRPGLWVNSGQLLALVVDLEHPRITGLVPEADLGRLHPGASGRFYPSTPEYPAIDLTLAAVDNTSLRQLKEPYLASVYSGPVAVVKKDGALVLQNSLYRFTLKMDSQAFPPPDIMPGTLNLEAAPKSLIKTLGQSLARLGIRESGF